MLQEHRVNYMWYRVLFYSTIYVVCFLFEPIKYIPITLLLIITLCGIDSWAKTYNYWLDVKYPSKKEFKLEEDIANPL